MMFLSGMGIVVTLPALFTRGYIRLVDATPKPRTATKTERQVDGWFDEVCTICSKYEKIYRLKAGTLLQQVCASRAEILEIRGQAERDFAISEVAKSMAESAPQDHTE
jgi:hypothetical protein